MVGKSHRCIPRPRGLEKGRVPEMRAAEPTSKKIGDDAGWATRPPSKAQTAGMAPSPRGKRSRGGGEVTERPRKAGNKAGATPAAAEASTASRLVRGIQGETPRRSHAGVAPGPRDKNPRANPLAGTARGAKLTGRSDEAKAREGMRKVRARRAPGTDHAQAGVGSERTKPGQQSAPGGRPRKGEEHKTLMAQKPWEKAGISRRTWYRQQERGK